MPNMTPATPEVESLTKRGYLFLEDADWQKADEYFDRVLDIDPEYAPAYAGKLCAEVNSQNIESLEKSEKAISESKNYQKAVRFGDDDYRSQLESYAGANKERVSKAKNDLAQIRERIAKYQVCLATGPWHTAALKKNGTVVAVGSANNSGACETNYWQDIIAITAGDYNTIGLKVDGKIVIAGKIFGYNWEKEKFRKFNKDDWRDIVAVTCNGNSDDMGNIVGIKKNGTVIAAGSNDSGQCETDDWRNIIAVSACDPCFGGSGGAGHTIGLKADGTVVAIGSNKNGSCDVQGWRDIVAISTSTFFTIGLKADGTVVATGDNYRGQCNVQDWRDIVAVYAGDACSIGLKVDGSLVVAGYRNEANSNIDNWKNIVALSMNTYHTVGLKADGTVIVTGENKYGQCNVQDWRGIGPVSKESLMEHKYSSQYSNLLRKMESASSESKLQALIKGFRAMKGYKDSSALGDECQKRLNEMVAERQRQEEKEKEETYAALLARKQDSLNEEQLEQLARDFHNMNGYKDTKALAQECEEQLQQVIEERNRQEALARETHYQKLIEDKNKLEAQEITDANIDGFCKLLKEFRMMSGYRDTTELAVACHKEAEERQSKYWEKQGLCRYCGCELGLFKKCKSKDCARKN
jgi:alpha-tubulin suppressor-like RCC1 family protein